MRHLLAPFVLGVTLAACGAATGMESRDAAPVPTDVRDVLVADQCGQHEADLAPPRPGCRVVNRDPCTGRGTIVCDDAGTDGGDGASEDVAHDAADDACLLNCPAPPPGCHYEGQATCEPRYCGRLVCPADDAGSASDAAVACGEHFPSFRQDCARDEDCVVAVRLTDCCGNERGVGLHASQRAAFEAAEGVCRSTYSPCDCPANGILCDDTRWASDTAVVGVACRAGRCSTFVR